MPFVLRPLSHSAVAASPLSCRTALTIAWKSAPDGENEVEDDDQAEQPPRAGVSREDVDLVRVYLQHIGKRRLLKATLTQAGGNRTRAARALGLQRTYLLRLIREFEIRVPPGPLPARRAEAEGPLAATGASAQTR